MESLQSTVAELVTELFNLLGTGNVPLIAFVLFVTAGVLSCGVLFSYMFVSFCESFGRLRLPSQLFEL